MMNKYKISAIIAVVLFVVLAMPANNCVINDVISVVNISADSDESGSCGENCTYSFDSATGTLTISGTGNMKGFYYDSDNKKYTMPWYDYHESIKSVIIEDGVTSIGECAFSGCTGLTEITIPDSVTSISYRTFDGCKGLTRIVIPDSVTSIRASAFSQCKNLTEIIIPDSVTSIGNSAFYECYGLTEIIIPDSVTSIEGEVFYGCSRLTDVYFKGTELQWRNITIDSNNEKLLNATIHFAKGNPFGENLTYSFDFSTRTLTISGTGKMGDFSYDSVPWCDYREFVESVIIEDGVTSIGVYAFKDCTVLKEITIPDSVAFLGKEAFRGCTGLTKVTIPAGVASIGEGEFRGCKGLTQITIPDSVTYIGKCAFDGCSELKDVYFKGTKDQLKKISVYPYNEKFVWATKHFAGEETTASLLGDATGDGEIDIRDVALMNQYIVGIIDLSEQAILNSDIISDGEVNVKDLGQLKKYIVKLIDKF